MMLRVIEIKYAVAVWALVPTLVELVCIWLRSLFMWVISQPCQCRTIGGLPWEGSGEAAANLNNEGGTRQ
jgi:hypothetical protein